jgi:leucyl/phenylalanyl-tRNA---protein transferase
MGILGMSRPGTPGPAEYTSFFSRNLRRILPTGSELVWISSRVPVNALRAAYPLGIFPWPGGDPDLFPWVCPLERGVLPFDRLHVGKSTRRQLARARYRITRNTAFDRVIRACAEFPGRDTWIHPEMIRAYTAAHRQGFAHSVEVWDESDTLVGGLYGIDSGTVFSGESMFHTRPNAGKAAILHLVEHLQTRGHTLLDIQQLTPHLAALGAVEWSRTEYLRALGTPALIPDTNL